MYFSCILFLLYVNYDLFSVITSLWKSDLTKVEMWITHRERYTYTQFIGLEEKARCFTGFHQLSLCTNMEKILFTAALSNPSGDFEHDKLWYRWRKNSVDKFSLLTTQENSFKNDPFYFSLLNLILLCVMYCFNVFAECSSWSVIF